MDIPVDIHHLYNIFVNYARHGHEKDCIEIIETIEMEKNFVSDLYQSGYAPLCIATEYNLEHLCQFLVFKGTDVNKTTTMYGDTPLMISSANGTIDTVSLLINAGAIINQPNARGDTPLFFASKKGNGEICKKLISAGANVNHLNAENVSCLFIAAVSNKIELCKILISSGANVKQEKIYYYMKFLTHLGNGGNRPEIYCLILEEVKRYNKEILLSLLLERSYTPSSPFYKDSLPLEMLKLILEFAEIPFVITSSKQEK